LKLTTDDGRQETGSRTKEAEMSEQDTFTGAVLEGSGGELYLVPEAELAKFRVSGSKVAQMRALVDPDDTSGFGQVEVAFPVAPTITPLKAVHAQVPKSSIWYQGVYQLQGS
jgi:hypothetical protein